MFNQPPTSTAGRDPILDDIAAVSRIDVVKQILEVVCRSTGLGYAAIARVTDGRWIACAARDEMAFGLEPGGELEVETTICHQVRCRGKAITINDTQKEHELSGHQAPEQYGFRSCISVPIKLADGSMFGTLCAIAPKPIEVDTPQVLGMFTLFADLIGKYLDSQRRAVNSEAALTARQQADDMRERSQSLWNSQIQTSVDSLTAKAATLAHSIGEGDLGNLAKDIQSQAGQVSHLLKQLAEVGKTQVGR